MIRYNSTESIIDRFIGTDYWILVRLGEYWDDYNCDYFCDDFSTDCWINIQYVKEDMYYFSAVFDNRNSKYLPVIKM